ncbi:hypothetical protein R3P38DRAFT_3547592 [Favolaschia claudopus]|uniref:F-box domain-containing protein n=1 Tax=Favolaschia claudopus TaxID=2862362 RepID=A0AAW0DZL9_9AGAR
MSFSGFTSSALPTPEQTSYIISVVRSGAPPPDVPSLRAIISTAPPELERYDEELEQNRAEYQRLLSERNSLSSYAKSCNSLFAPVRRLPRELLAEILDLCCLDENSSFSRTPDQEIANLSHRRLRQLAQVCTVWHQSAMGTPKLWRRVSVRTKLWGRSSVSPETLLSLLAFSLSQSGRYPLNLRLSATSLHPESLSVLALVVKHSARWKDINMIVDTGLQGALAGANGELDQLTELRLSSVAIESDVFGQAPRLTKVSLEGTPRLTRLPDLPWQQLVTITYKGKVGTESFNVLSLLSVATKVRTVEFYLDMLRASSIDSWNSVTSNARSLALRLAVHDADLVGHIFDCLTLPNLRTLIFAPHADTIPVWEPNAFQCLASRSTFQDHLTYLILGARITDQQLLDGLAVLPNLEKLRVFDYPSHTVITDTFLLGLHVSGADWEPLVPRLRVFYMTTAVEFTDSVYVDLVTSRVNFRREGSSSFEVHLRCRQTRKRDVSSELVEKMAKLESESDGGFTFMTRLLDR